MSENHVATGQLGAHRVVSIHAFHPRKRKRRHRFRAPCAISPVAILANFREGNVASIGAAIKGVSRGFLSRCGGLRAPTTRRKKVAQEREESNTRDSSSRIGWQTCGGGGSGTEFRWVSGDVPRPGVTMLTGKTRLTAVRRDARNFCHDKNQ